MSQSVGSVCTRFSLISVENDSIYKSQVRETAEDKLYYLRDSTTPDEFDQLVDAELQRSFAKSNGSITFKDLAKSIMNQIHKASMGALRKVGAYWNQFHPLSCLRREQHVCHSDFISFYQTSSPLPAVQGLFSMLELCFTWLTLWKPSHGSWSNSHQCEKYSVQKESHGIIPGELSTLRRNFTHPNSIRPDPSPLHQSSKPCRSRNPKKDYQNKRQNNLE